MLLKVGLLRKLSLLSICLCQVLCVQAQCIVRGSVHDAETGLPLPNAILRLYRMADNTRVIADYTIATEDGTFRLQSKQAGRHILSCSMLGYGAQSDTLMLAARETAHHVFRLKTAAIELREVQVKSTPIRRSNDTVSYRVQSFARAGDRNLENVLRRMPGITVEGNGAIKYQGKSIDRLYIEDLDLLAERYVQATRTLKPEDVASVQVYENHQPVKALREREISDRAALNIRLKQKALGRWLFDLLGAAGADGTQLLGQGEATAMAFNRKWQILSTAKANNRGEDYRSLSNQSLSKGELSPYVNRSLSYGMPSSAEAPRAHAEMASMSGVFRLRGDDRLRVYTDFTRQSVRAHQHSRRIYLPYSKEERQAVEEDLQQHPQRMATQAEAAYEHNADEEYLNQLVKVSGNWNNETATVTENGRMVLEQLSNRMGNLYGQTRWIRHVGARLFEVSANVKYMNMPRYRLDVTADGRTYASQQAGDRHLEGVLGTQWNHRVGSSGYLGIVAEGIFTRQWLWSEGQWASSDTPIINRLDGWISRWTLAPTYTYTGDRFSLTLRSPVAWRYMPGNSGQRRTTQSHPYGGLSGRLFWRLKSHKLTLSMGWNADVSGQLSDYALEPIIRSYRRQYTPGGQEPIRHYHFYAEGNWEYNDISQGMFAHTKTSYQSGHRNFITTYRLNGNDEGEGKNSNYRSKTEQIMLTHGMSKYFMESRLTLKLHTQFDLGRMQNLFNGNLINQRQIDWEVRPSMDFSPLSLLNLRSHISYFYSGLNTSKTEQSDMHCATWGLTCEVFPMKRLSAYATGVGEMLWMNKEPRRHNLTITAGVRYALPLWEIWLEGRNLGADSHRITRSWDGITLFDLCRDLRPMDITVGMKYRF